MATLRDNGSIPVVAADSFELQPVENSNLVKGKWNGRIVVVKRLAVDVSEEILEDYARDWNSLKHPNISDIYIGDLNTDPFFIVVSTFPWQPSGYAQTILQIPFYEEGNISQYLARNPQSDRLRMVC